MFALQNVFCNTFNIIGNCKRENLWFLRIYIILLIVFKKRTYVCNPFNLQFLLLFHDHRHLSRLMSKPTKWHVRPAKTQISLGIRPVWSESSLCAQWAAKDQSFLHVDSEDSDKTGRMSRLIWVFAQADLSLCWAHMPFWWFCHEVAHLVVYFRKAYKNKKMSAFKTSLTFKCLIEHLLADVSYSRPLDTYLWKQMMKMNRNITYKWCNIAKKDLLFTKRKCHKFSWLFAASRCSPRRWLICACRIACKVLVSIGL